MTQESSVFPHDTVPFVVAREEGSGLLKVQKKRIFLTSGIRKDILPRHAVSSIKPSARSVDCLRYGRSSLQYEYLLYKQCSLFLPYIFGFQNISNAFVLF